MSPSASPSSLYQLQQRLAKLPVTRTGAATANRLGTPTVPVTLDGVEVDPRTISLHPDPLDLLPGVTPDEPLAAFTRPDLFVEAITARQGQRPDPTTLAPQDAPGSNGAYGSVKLYRDTNLTGPSWEFQAQWGGIPDFRKVFCFLWWCQNINDIVSSVDVGELNGLNQPSAFVCLCSDINYGGARLWLWSLNASGPMPGAYVDLRPYGFNDVASSMFYQALGHA